MRTFELRKLVRDEIPRLTEEAGGSMEVAVLQGDHLTGALLEKALEEIREMQHGEVSPEELADVQEVLDRLADLHGITPQTIQEVQEEKRTKAGTFLAGTFAFLASVPEDSELARYYSSRPDIFEEIK